MAIEANQTNVCTQTPPAVEDQVPEQVMPPCGALTAKQGQRTGIILKQEDKMERTAKVGEEALGS